MPFTSSSFFGLPVTKVRTGLASGLEAAMMREEAARSQQRPGWGRVTALLAIVFFGVATPNGNRVLRAMEAACMRL